MFAPPAHALGADLIWWRTSDGMRTIVSLMWGRIQPFTDTVHLQAILFSADGQPQVAWRIELPPDQPVFIDSAAEGPWRQHQGSDGILALYACTDGEPSAEALSRYNRLFPLLDWQLADGRLATLHSDQTIRRGHSGVQEFTEIVVMESTNESNALVLLNGDEPQAENALELTVRNTTGVERVANYRLPMAPFTAHRIELRTMFPDLVEFSQSQPVMVSGRFNSRGIFSRPYIETTGSRWGVYHGGNVYDWSELPFFAHAVIGGEVNPIAVVHDDLTRTYVNILHSHGHLETDIPVDAVLYDEEGICVARRSSWRIARRGDFVRADIAEIVSDPTKPFRGHVALSFALIPRQSVPRHLQVLMEYRRDCSVAHTMTWSDEWNSRVRLAKRERASAQAAYLSWFRVWQAEDTFTEIAVVNAGHAGYDRCAHVDATLCTGTGVVARKSFILAPYATLTTTMADLFPEAITALKFATFAAIVLESSSDLASVGFTHDRRTGAMACEHFMCLQSEHDGAIVLPAGY
jgi:hypothetical protein